MPPVRLLVSSLRGMAAPAFALALSLATSFADRPRLNEAPPVPAPVAAPQGALAAEAAPSGFVVDPASREASRIFFRTVYAASENVPIGWNGNVATGNEGTTSAAFKEAVQRRVNYFRAMAGVPAGITFDPTYNARDQKAALMMSANDDLRHDPPATWIHYSADGADAAAHSNIFLGTYGPAAITGYIEDYGSPNAAAGHRRWMLHPQTKKMGTGDIPRTAAYDSANALWVSTPDYGSARPAVRDDFIAWPPPGYVPYSLVFPRWSFAYPGADFASATVTMQRGGANVPVAIETRGTGPGDAALVWAWDNLDPNTAPPPDTPPASDTPVQVAVNGVVINGQSRNFAYTVTIFDPRQAGADTVLAAVNGPAQTTVGASQSYSCTAVPNASGYQFRTAPLTALTAIEGAESGAGNVIVDAPSATAIVSSAYHATGAKSFHFTTPLFDRQAITLKRTVLAGPASTLKFKSRFGYATASQVAHAEVSTDDGISWDTLFTAAGTNTPSAGFAAQTVSLAAYASRTLMVRFVFAYEGDGSAYTQTDENIGWYLDDIAFGNAQELTSALVGTAGASTTHSFTPAAAGDFAVQARGQFFGDYLFEWGSALAVNAGANAAPKITKHPLSRTVSAGGSVEFQVVATGPGTLSYQWFHGTQRLVGETAASLVLSNLLPADAGSYRVEVTNAMGTTPSNAATLTVTVPNPLVTTGDGIALSETAVELSGHVDVIARTVTCGFEYGTTTSLGSIAPAGSATATQDFAATVSSIAGNAPIYYRAFAEVDGGARFRGAVKKVAPWQPIAVLDVVADPAGGGSVSGLPVGVARAGDPIALTAQPAPGFAFTGWTGGLKKSTATIAFAMPAALTLTANFSSSPIIQAAGKYRGLALASPVTHASCGIVNLTVGAKGAFSGLAVIGGTKFPLKGVFDAAGIAHFGTATEATLARPGRTPLLLRLQLPTGNVSPTRVLGEVRETGGFTATIDAPRIFFTSAKNPVAPLLNPPPAWPGSYTADLTVTPSAELAGFGWITVTVGKAGSVRFTGALADGTRWTSTQTLLPDGTVPIHAALYGGKGSLFGSVQFAGSPVTIAATAHWYRPPNLAGTRFLAGWPDGLDVTIAGGARTPFKPNVSWQLPGLAATSGAAHLWAGGGGLAPDLDWGVTFSFKAGTAIVTPASATTATFIGNATSGIFTGTFKTSPTAKPIGFSGALLPGADRARGYFLTPTGSGSILLQPQ